MQYISTTQTYIPIRNEPSHKSEQVSQLLFGEQAKVEETQGDWLKIITKFDNYTGWVEKKVTREIPKHVNIEVVSGFERLIKENNESVWLPTGCEIYSGLFNPEKDFRVKLNPELNEKDIIAVAAQFLGTPYLWGGRTFMGIDCSGLTQVVYKALGINLPRDAYQQVEHGENVSFVTQAQPGDLAFFDNEEGDINHVGIIVGNGTILHASGSVRIDKIDQQGIFNAATNGYTHKLRVVKRL